jgi:hypothetical protein
MNNEPNPVEPNTLGTIRHIDGLGQIHVEWDNGRTLAVIPEIDEYEIIDEEFARGGFVGKGEKVWNKMTSSERMSFLYENFTPEITPRSQEILVGRTFNFLPKNVKMKLESKYANVEYAQGGEVASFEKKIKDAMKEENKWHFIDEVVDGKNVQLKMFVGKKEVDVQIFRIDGRAAGMPKNYAGKRETLKMIMDNFQTKMESSSVMAKGGKIETFSIYPQRKVNIAKPAGEELYTTDFKSTFRVVGTLSEAEAQAQKFVTENESMFPFVEVKKIHPSGNPLKNKTISRVEKDKITKL